MTHLLVFLTGVAFEMLYTLWVRAAIAQSALKAAFWAMAVGSASLFGVGSVMHDKSTAPALLLGYGVGSYVIVRFLAK